MLISFHAWQACLSYSIGTPRQVCLFFLNLRILFKQFLAQALSHEKAIYAFCVFHFDPQFPSILFGEFQREKKNRKKYKEINGSIRWNAGHYATIRFFNPFFSEQTMARFHVYNFLCFFYSHFFLNRNKNSQNYFKPKRTTFQPFTCIWLQIIGCTIIGQK